MLSRFLSIRTPILKISFTFIGGIGQCFRRFDWRIVVPDWPIFLGYTITTVIAGLIYGLFLYKESPLAISDRKFAIKTISAVALVVVIVNMRLNTLCMSLTTGKAFLLLFWARLLKQLIMTPIQVSIFLAIEKALQNVALNYLYDEDYNDKSAESGI